MDEVSETGTGGSEPGWTRPERGFFLSPAPELAPALLGCLLVSENHGGRTSGIIVETEAYTGDDPASHSRSGRTARNGSMFEEGGRAYVYRIYGIHFCFNVTAGPAGSGEAVLIRALEPREGIELMMERRRTALVTNLANGPARLCQALDIRLEHDGAQLDRASGAGPLLLVRSGGRIPPCSQSSRIGISRATDRQWRFYLPGSPFLSRRSP